MSKEVWYQKWESEYLGTEDEAKGFVQWYNAEKDDDLIDPEVSDEEILNTYRGTQWWTDSFLDWAWIQEASLRTDNNNG